MIAMIKFAFELDLTRVVAFTLSGASSGQTWPSRGVHTAHHTLEHNGDINGLVKIDTYYAEKFAGLLTALKSIDDGGGKTALYNSSVFLGMECWSNSVERALSDQHPVRVRGPGRRSLQDRPDRQCHGPQQQRHPYLLPASGRRADQHVRPAEPVQGADHMSARERHAAVRVLRALRSRATRACVLLACTLCVRHRCAAMAETQTSSHAPNEKYIETLFEAARKYFPGR